MIAVTREERQWLLRNIAQGIASFAGCTGPPVPVEKMLKCPPPVYANDFGVVNMVSNLWDATFARPPNQRGAIFVRIDLEEDDRRYALARETFSALITSKHGRDLGLPDLFIDSLQPSADYFAGHLLTPEPLLDAYRRGGGTRTEFASTFKVPPHLAAQRWEEARPEYLH